LREYKFPVIEHLWAIVSYLPKMFLFDSSTFLFPQKPLNGKWKKKGCLRGLFVFYAVGHADNGCSVPEYPAISIDSRWFFKARK
jgi:hypothetical protein